MTKTLGNQLFSIFTTEQNRREKYFCCEQEDNIERLSFLMRNGVYITDWNHCDTRVLRRIFFLC